MTRPRVRVEAGEADSGRVVMEDERARYVARVLRLKAGERVWGYAADGREVEMIIEEAGARRVVATVVGMAQAATEPRLKVTVCLGVLKGKAMVWAVQKVTEVGAARIVPVVSERVVVRMDGREATEKTRRWQEVAEEAARQCRRTKAPEVETPVTVAEMAERCRDDDRPWLLFDSEAEETVPVEKAVEGAEAAAIIVGPEGDLSPAEKQTLYAAGAVAVGLGPRVMRAETAAVVACAVVLHAAGDLGLCPRALKSESQPWGSRMGRTIK
jgi:16S rRNA (uracil1498-N3)-methyltransferase